MEAVTQTLIMALLIGVGAVCFKTKLISEKSLKSISGVALKVAVPCVIINSFQKDFSSDKLNTLLYSLGLSAAAIAISLIISYLAVRGKDKEKLSIERFSSIYSNCAFMGIPLINGIYGEEGVFCLTTFYVLFNILVWSHGIFMIKGEKNLKSVLNVLKAPAFIAIVIGVILFSLRIKLPDIIDTSVDYLAGLSTPLGMILAGATIAQTNILRTLKKWKIYFICGLRLLIIPIITIFAFLPLPAVEPAMGTIVLANACPTAVICTTFAINLNKDSLYASEIFAVSTLLSMATIPLISLIYDAVRSLV